MTGYIYKITNNQNNKIYVGQTLKTLAERLDRHVYDALYNPKPLQTKFAKAIRKYGPESFSIALIEQVNGEPSQITDREYFWIATYDSVKCGYNSSDARCKCGGNTYFGKSELERNAIKQKIRDTKLGALNPNSRAIKCLNVKTNEVLYFETLQSAAEFFEEANHQFVSRRVCGQTKKLYKETYLFAYVEDEFIQDYHLGTATPRNRQVILTSITTGQKQIFESISVAEKQFGWFRGAISKHQAKGHYKDYLIEVR